MAAKEDHELEAMKACHAALLDLTPDERSRVVEWLVKKLEVSQASAPPNGQGAVPTVPATPPGHGTQLSAKTFLAQKRPSTDVERVACLAYYLTHHRDVGQFKTRDLSKLNGEAALPKLSNPTVAVQNATRQSQFLAEVGGGSKQLTVRGEALVGALPDREQVKAAMQSHPLTRRKKHTKKERKHPK